MCAVRHGTNEKAQQNPGTVDQFVALDLLGYSLKSPGKRSPGWVIELVCILMSSICFCQSLKSENQVVTTQSEVFHPLLDPFFRLFERVYQSVRI